MAPSLRLGLFPYLNVQPLIFGLRDDAGMELVIDLPSRIADRFRNGDLDLAMVPSFEAATLAGAILDSVCIASDGPVETVILHHRVPLNQIKTIALDEASRTSAALAKMLVAEASGAIPRTLAFSPIATEAPEADAFLVIGDPAFRFSRAGFVRLDLGGEWQSQHSLPFVFAVMVQAPRVDAPGICGRLRDAARRGVEAAPSIARSYNSGVDTARAEHYMQNVIRYELGQREKEGLALFYRLARASGLLNQTSEKELEFHGI